MIGEAVTAEAATIWVLMVIMGRRAARREEEHVDEPVEEHATICDEHAIVCEEHVCEEHVLVLSTDDGDAPPPPPPPLLPSPAPPHALTLPAPLALYRPS